MVNHRFIGRDRLIRRMRQLPVEARTAARDSLDQQAAFLVEQIRPNVPRDHGELADSLEWHRSPSRARIRVVITEGLSQDGDPGNHKAFAVEFGRPASSESGAMEAQPHFFPTYRAHKRKMQNAIQKAVRDAVRRIWGGGGK